MSDDFSVVRQAHRICAAYYQQIMPLIYETAQRLETVFMRWETWSFNKPPQASTNPFETWRWNYLTMMDVSFAFSFQQEPGSTMTTEDYVLDFNLVTDSELSSTQREKHYADKEPAAIDLRVSAQDASSYLGVYLFAATGSGLYATPKTLWYSYDGYPKADGAVALSDNDQIKGIGFKIHLHELANDRSCDLLVEKIRAHLATLQAHRLA